jgi:hypothetical protein
MIAAALALAAPFTGTPAAPPVVADSYRVRIEVTGEGAERATIAAPGRLRFRTLGRPVFLEVTRGGTTFVGRAEFGSGSILRGNFAAQPDGALLSGFPRHDLLVSYVVAQARAGALPLTASSVGGRAAWRADVGLPANDCAGLAAQSVRVWLSQRTLYPLRVEERVASTHRLRRVTTYAYSGIGAAVPARVFAPPALGPRPFVTNNRFTRTSPRAAAGPLPYTPRLPSLVPPGFRLAMAGWAPRGSVTGPEGSIPARPWLFAALYRRGQEYISVTQRVSRRDWPDDPFGGECQPLFTEPVTINGVAATYGIGQSTVPHLYWRDGPLLYTVSGPFPKDDLIAIAASLRTLGS